jgi:hypothetical protein
MFGDGFLEQRHELGGAFPVGDAPAHDPSAENIDDDVEIEVRPLGRRCFSIASFSWNRRRPAPAPSIW